jgi:hypothetical protein
LEIEDFRKDRTSSWNSDFHNTIFIGKSKGLLNRRYGILWQRHTGLKVYEGEFSGDELFGFGKKYHMDTVDHPVPKFIGNFCGDVDGVGAIYHSNGKIGVRGAYCGGKTSKDPSVVYSETGRILSYGF